ncbi:MAG TPA: helix-turn-helix transcriptional regulator [Streptosporangiaceae bacterium]|nr:helix-turn-helix transcriptional regulator [Streptosporangiaceae bacterium]
MDFGTLLSGLMTERGLGVRALARHVPCDPALISRLASGRQQPSAQIARRLDEVLDAGGELSDLASLAPDPGPVFDDELGAIEAARRAGATEVGAMAVERLEQVMDTLAMAYPSSAPAKLLSRTGAYLAYATGLLGRKATLSEHRRLLVTSGWLSLLAATSLIDLRRYDAADAYLTTAMQMAAETGHPELSAWCLETRAWQAVSDGDYARAASLARSAQALAPRGSSALIQATAQEGRAWARLGSPRDTCDALTRVEALVSPLPVPDQPEHHYRYDPAKAEAYVATTLSWLGDPAAVDIARSVLAKMESPADPRPRRAVAARIDLALALAGAGRPDEAGEVTLEAVTSPYLVPSNYWRADEVIAVVESSDPEGSRALREAITARRQVLPGKNALRSPEG